MSKTFSALSITLILLVLTGCYIYSQNQVYQIPIVFSPLDSGSISDTKQISPIRETQSGDIDESIYTSDPLLTTTGAKGLNQGIYNITWTPRTLSGVSYQFGLGNPKEVDKSVEELVEMNKKCLENYSPESCDEREVSLQGEYIGILTNDDGTFKEFDRKPSRMTPEIEYLVYSFLSSPIIKNSSEVCGHFFWRDGQQGSPFYNNETMHEDMGEVISENWWKPYNIDINHLIVINPSTGRKELNSDPIWTLRTQIMSPPVTYGQTGHYTNIKLTECLQKNNILVPLQAHVDRHYRELMWLWREYKVEN